MKKVLLLFAVCITTSLSASAQEKETVVTGSISLMVPADVQVLDEFISDQLYTGETVFTGLNVRLGAFYRKHDNLSWDIYYTHFGRAKWVDNLNQFKSLKNPANSQYLKFNSYTAGYGTYYHWQFGRKLMIKAGGMFDVYGALKQAVPDGVNNALNIDGQIMLKAHGAVKYGWDFKKWGLDIYGRISLPVVGLIAADHPSESSLSMILPRDYSVIYPDYRHLFLASYHNYMSLDYELGLDFVLKNATLTFGFGNSSKWWNIYDIQNIRDLGYLRFGVAFDIVPRGKFQSPNTNF